MPTTSVVCPPRPRKTRQQCAGVGSRSRKARTGYYSEVTRDNAFALSMDTHQPNRLRVYALLIFGGAATRHTIGEKLGLPLHVVCARVNELMKAGLATDTEASVMNTDTKKPNNLVKAVVHEPELFPAQAGISSLRI